ncbi:MAG: hypothetical protein R3D51_07920 [Hyphomicrobiaceae bacterium]
MMKMLAAGLWGVAVATATGVVSDRLGLFLPPQSSGATVEQTETIVTGIMRVPIMANENPAGYVLLDLSIDYDVGATEALAGKMKSIAIDESFRAVYEKSAADFRDARKSDLNGLLKEIGHRIDGRIAIHAIKDVRINEFMFAPPRKSS